MSHLSSLASRMTHELFGRIGGALVYSLYCLCCRTFLRSYFATLLPVCHFSSANLSRCEDTHHLCRAMSTTTTGICQGAYIQHIQYSGMFKSTSARQHPTNLHCCSSKRFVHPSIFAVFGLDLFIHRSSKRFIHRSERVSRPTVRVSMMFCGVARGLIRCPSTYRVHRPKGMISTVQHRTPTAL